MRCWVSCSPSVFFLNDTAPTEIYTLPLHDALPICRWSTTPGRSSPEHAGWPSRGSGSGRDRKSTRLNSSHMSSSYAVFCLKKQTTSRWRHCIGDLCEHEGLHCGPRGG